MKELQKVAIMILERYGSVILFNRFNESKILYSVNDVKVAFKLARAGAIEAIVSVH